jgi:hypothetical protein
VCVWVRERERESVCVCERERERESVCVCVCVPNQQKDIIHAHTHIIDKRTLLMPTHYLCVDITYAQTLLMPNIHH